MKIKAARMGSLSFLILFGCIGAAMAADLWSTTKAKEPSRYASGEYAGSYNPADIRGSYTFAEVSDLFKVDIKVLYKAFGIQSNEAASGIQVKDLEAMYTESGMQIGTESVQVFVALYKNLPVELNDAYLPKEAVDMILQANTALTEEQKNYLAAHTAETEGTVSKADEAVDGAESVVNGSATFQKVLDAGLTREEIEGVIKAELPPTNQTVKDYCVKNGLSFPEIKDMLNALIDQK